MMTNDLMLGGVYILMAMMLVLGALMTRREPAAKLVKMALAWVVIFAAGFVLFTFRDDFGYLAERLKAEAIGTPVTEGRVTRIPMAIDRQTARDAGVKVSPRADEFVRTGNGIIRVARGRADELTVGDIVRKDVGL